MTALSVAVTRPFPQGARTLARLRAMGFAARAMPLLAADVVSDGGAAPHGALAFTSRTAPMCLAGRADLKHLPVFAVGDGTAREAKGAGFQDVRSAGGDVAALAQLLIAEGVSALTHMSGEEQKGDLAGAMRRAGVTAERRVIYRMVPASTIAGAPADIVTLYSPRTAAVFAQLAAGTAWRGAICVALSADVAAALPVGFASHAARQPDEAGMFDALCRLPA